MHPTVSDMIARAHREDLARDAAPHATRTSRTGSRSHVSLEGVRRLLAGWLRGLACHIDVAPCVDVEPRPARN